MIYGKLYQKVAEEAQLLAEEKWIIQALRRCQCQKNGLLIERLHLENLRKELINKINRGKGGSASTNQTDIGPTTENINPPQATETQTIQPYDPLDELNFDNQINDNNGFNTEELNLSVTNPVFTMDQYRPESDEEEDEDIEEDENLDNYILDIDLLMSTK